MPSIHIPMFGGLVPAIEAKSLKGHNATVSHNTMLRDSSLRAFKAPLEIDPLQHVGDTTKKNSVYRVSDTECCCGGAVTFDCDSSVIEMTNPGDCSGWCHVIVFPCCCDGNYKAPYRYLPCDNDTCPLIVPRPLKRLIARQTTPGTNIAAHPYAGPDERSYTYTWVDKFGVESPPAAPTEPKCSYDDDVWTLSNFETPPSNAVCVRIYRSASYFESEGDQQNPVFASSYQLVEERPLTMSTLGIPQPVGDYIDSRCLKELDYGTLQTEMDCPPPCMEKVIATEAGYMVGFSGNTLYVSERYEAHNWPEKNRMELPDKIVSIAVMMDFVFIGTTGRPYRMNVAFVAHNGVAEVTLDPVPYTEHYPCLSRHSMVSTEFGAMYTTHKGLVALAPQGAAKLITRTVVDEDDWYEWAPNYAVYHNGKYFASQSPVGKSWIYDVPDNAEANVDLGALVTIDWSPDAAHSGRDGRLYYVRDNKLFVWNESHNKMTYTWRSKVFRSHGHTQFAAIKVVGDYGQPVTVRVLADGRLFDELTIKNSKPRRLRFSGRGIYWQIEVQGITDICEVHIASSINELTQQTR